MSVTSRRESRDHRTRDQQRSHAAAIAGMSSGGPVKLHVGCGQRYLDGYINIDFPPEEHTVQQDSVADVLMDVRDLRMGPESVEEVRSHHVFEHFARPEACALLASWISWLVPGGLIRIETPDFSRSAMVALLHPDRRHRSVAIRHIFGSNEAPWAVHLDGWSAARLREVMESFGLSRLRVRRSSWHGTHNVEIVGILVGAPPALETQREAAKRYLSRFLVDASDSEQRLLSIWLDQFDKLAARCGARSAETTHS